MLITGLACITAVYESSCNAMHVAFCSSANPFAGYFVLMAGSPCYSLVCWSIVLLGLMRNDTSEVLTSFKVVA